MKKRNSAARRDTSFAKTDREIKQLAADLKVHIQRNRITYYQLACLVYAAHTHCDGAKGAEGFISWVKIERRTSDGVQNVGPHYNGPMKNVTRDTENESILPPSPPSLVQRTPQVGDDVLIKVRGRGFKIGSVHIVAPHNTITIVVEDAPHVAPDAARKFYYDANAADMQFDATNKRWTVESAVLEVLK